MKSYVTCVFWKQLPLLVNPSRPNPGQREKTNLYFYFHIFCDASIAFMKALKGFRKPFEPSQGSVKTKI